MAIYPHLQLFVGPARVIVISGPHIQIVESQTGVVPSTTANFEHNDRADVVRSGPIRCAAVDNCWSYLATIGDDKILKVWHIRDELRLLSQRDLPKRSTAIQFTRDGQTILVSDKFGDVFSYSLYPSREAIKQQRGALASHENPSDGSLVLGHTSLLTSFLLSRNEKYIITADRDEHIRVSWYPQGYNIETYCLAHRKFVSAIHIPKFSASTLISGGGDPILMVWDWMLGTVTHEIAIRDSVLPYIKIRPNPMKQGGNDGDERSAGNREKRRRRRQSRKVQADDDEALDEIPSRSHAKTSTALPETESQVKIGDYRNLEVCEEEEVTLVVHKIDSILAEEGSYLVFSIVGATALFICRFSEVTEGDIQTFDFQKPVIDFNIDDNGIIWVCLDGEWGDRSEVLSTKMVRALKLVSGKPAEVDDEQVAPLLMTLNSHCLLPATHTELMALDLYAPLTSFPKTAEAEKNSGDIAEMLFNAVEGADLAGQPVNKKVLGRLKHKKALMKRVQVTETGSPAIDEGSKLETNAEELQLTGTYDIG